MLRRLRACEQAKPWIDAQPFGRKHVANAHATHGH
jgi:hypothetical protein